MSAEKLRVGLLGCGTVGRGVVQLLDREHDRIRDRHGVELSIESPASPRSMARMIGIPPQTLASKPMRAPDALAAAKSSRPDSASSALFAVTTSRPSRSARRT